MRRSVVLAALLVSGCLSEEQRAERAAEALIEEAKSAAAQTLLEPSSATFSAVEAREGKVCGLVNGRNAFGGYGARTKFVYSAGQATLDPSSKGAGGLGTVFEVERCDFDTRYRQCRGEQGFDVLDRCLVGERFAAPGVEMTKDIAHESCLSALEQRFNQDIRAAQLKMKSASSNKTSDGWVVKVEWEAMGPGFSGLEQQGRCFVGDDGNARVIALMAP